MPNAHGAEYEAMAIDDDYDPRKPEYIIPATEEEMTHTSTELLGKQISRLEVLVERRQAESIPQTYHHYEQVIAEMRYEEGQRAGKNKSSHFRMRSDPAKQPERSDPAKQPDEAVNDGPRTFTHSRIRSAPAPAFSADIVPPDDKPPHANRVHGSRPLRSPGEQLAARNVSTYTTLLGPSVRPAVCLSPKLLQGASKGLNRTVARVPQPSTPTSGDIQFCAGELLKPAQVVLAKNPIASPQRGTTQRRRPSTPPLGKAMGPRPGHIQSTNFVGPLCGDLVDELTNEWVVSRPCVASRLPGVAHIMRI